jgi:hypothetical protein
MKIIMVINDNESIMVIINGVSIMAIIINIERNNGDINGYLRLSNQRR